MGRGRKGPTPSCLPPPEPVAQLVDYDDVRLVMREVCWRKVPIDSHRQARRVAAQLSAREGEVLEPYRCPFHTLTTAKHWHVGHPPSQNHVRRLAAVIRWCTANPDELPIPHDQVPPGRPPSH